jgi:hypothetical protein
VSKNTETWVVVRFDGPAQEHSDYVSVKGVYDSHSEAQAAAERAASSHPRFEASYHIFRSRRLYPQRDVGDTPSHVRERPSSEARVQGFSPSHLEKQTWYLLSFLSHEPLHSLLNAVPPEIRARAVQPLLAYYAQAAIARALSGVVASEETNEADIRLPDGRTVEVKVLFLDPHKNRSPMIELPSQLPDYLALVLVEPNLTLTSARLIPSEVLARYERPGSKTRESRRTNVRVTPDLMTAPGTSNIDLSSPGQS